MNFEIGNLEPDKDDIFSYIGTCSVWDNAVDINIDFGNAENKQELLAEYLPLLKQHLDWLNQHKKDAVQALLDDDFLELAEDWASSGELAEDEEQECYLMEDGQKVFLPVTEKDFSDSLCLDVITFDCTEGRHHITMDLYMSCSPDYFAYHTVIVYVAEDGTMESGGLAG